MIGSQINAYRVESLLGRGGMVSVYFAWDTRQERAVALKILDDRYREIPSSVKRFIQEAQVIAAWDHPHIVHVLDAGEDQGVYYYAMEFIRGLDLAQLLRQYKEAGHLLPYDEVLRLGWAIANALDFAHQNGIIHRDVKPSNILVSVDGRILTFTPPPASATTLPPTLTATRRSDSRVWTRTMRIYYAGEEIGACRSNDRICEFELEQPLP